MAPLNYLLIGMFLLGFLLGVYLTRKHRSYRIGIDNEYMNRLVLFGKNLKNLSCVRTVNYRSINNKELPDVNGRNVAGQVQDLIKLAQQAHRVRSD